jgi:hypothetical protein
MALLFLDGFDHYGTAANPGTLGKWGATSGTAQTDTVPRTGVCALRCNLVGQLTSKPLAASGGAVVGFAWRASAAGNQDILQVLEGATVHVTLATAAGNLFAVKRGATVLNTGTHAYALNTWYYLELLTVIHDTAGSYELRIDGVPEISASSVDTRNVGTTGQWDRILLQGAATSNYFDDLYVCDTSGAAPRNTFLGSVKVETLLPQPDATALGSNQGLTPSTGTDHGALVDEVGPNTTDFNSAATVGLKDTYQYPSLALTGTILGIQTNLYVNKADAVARQVCAVVRAGGVDYDGASVAPTTTFAYVSEVRAQNPNTGADWTSVQIAALEAGMKVTV